jgi:hypothetical protein
MSGGDGEIEETLNGPSLRALLDVWDQATGRDSWRSIERRAIEQGNADGAAVARRALADHQGVSALDGLRANERIVSLLTGWRYQAMRQAREEGHSWSEIGGALNMSKQAAWESYKLSIENQERYVPDLFQPADADRYRAQLTDFEQADDPSPSPAR